MLNRFYPIPERYGRTDKQTDRFAISILRVSMLTRDKKTVTNIPCMACNYLCSMPWIFIYFATSVGYSHVKTWSAPAVKVEIKRR